jgi:hypothetical protein
MSYTSLYEIYKTKKLITKEFDNGYGSAPPVWDYLCSHYLNVESIHMLFNKQPLWNLIRDTTVPLSIRLCHAFTFDYAIVSPEHFPLMSEACADMQHILKTWPAWTNNVTHWGLFSEFFKTLKVNKRCLGIGMQVTSCSDVWDEYPKYGKDRMFNCVEEVLTHDET